ncbi:hypothetical protein FB645_002492 [Coemansia sp. IMI 203386]|nr:hypothetical protein FB645_002492 [Coemansia sp. IMI 203386]
MNLVVMPTIVDDVTTPSGNGVSTTPSGGNAATTPTGSDTITTSSGDDGSTTTGSNTTTTSGDTTAGSSSSEAFDPNTVYDGVPDTPATIPDENNGTETPATLTTPSE